MIIHNLRVYCSYATSNYDLEKELKTLKTFCSSMGMTVNIDKSKVMIIKSQNMTYVSFMYDENNLEEVTSCKRTFSIFINNIKENLAYEEQKIDIFISNIHGKIKIM